MATKKYTKEEIDKMDDLTEYERVENMTEEEIRKNAKSDADAPLQSEEDLKGFERVKSRKDKSNE